jgi:regulator of cell morphogenesis and NO signaling
MTTILEKTLADIVTENHEAAAIFEKYDLDFCCKGKRSLSTACLEKDISSDVIIKELENISSGEQKHTPFSEMDEEQLISYILVHHHFYVKQSMPTIVSHLEKVAAKHGERFPYMIDALQLFYEIQNDMTSHMMKEENILFPRIKAVITAIAAKEEMPQAGFIDGPVSVMEMEHDAAGAIMNKIKILTNNYSAPEAACTTFRVVLDELKHFEEDLHKHVHLENNILFPKAASHLS